jgi:uncharacterized protein (DUF362 family)
MSSTASSVGRVTAFTGTKSYRSHSDIFALVHQTLMSLGLPADIIRPGDRVVMKPNWVREHDERKPGPDQWEHVVTHPSVIGHPLVACRCGGEHHGTMRLVRFVVRHCGSTAGSTRWWRGA